VDISSYPHVFLGLRDLITFLVSFVVENLSCMFGKDLLKRLLPHMTLSMFCEVITLNKSLPTFKTNVWPVNNM
jgi:hypothetical protein